MSLNLKVPKDKLITTKNSFVLFLTKIINTDGTFWNKTKVVSIFQLAYILVNINTPIFQRRGELVYRFEKHRCHDVKFGYILTTRLQDRDNF